MNHEQWEALKAEMKGCPAGPDAPFKPMAKNHGDILLAAAPDLLAEVERLRGWIALVNDSIQVSRDPWLQRVLAAALSGAEVPK